MFADKNKDLFIDQATSLTNVARYNVVGRVVRTEEWLCVGASRGKLSSGSSPTFPFCYVHRSRLRHSSDINKATVRLTSRGHPEDNYRRLRRFNFRYFLFTFKYFFLE